MARAKSPGRESVPVRGSKAKGMHRRCFHIVLVHRENWYVGYPLELAGMVGDGAKAAAQ